MRLSFIVAAALLMTADLAQAQIPTSSAEFRTNTGSDARKRGAIELVRLTKCALQRREALGLNILTTRPGSADQERMVDPFRRVMENCMNDLVPGIYFGNSEVRGTIAGEIYLKTYPVQPDFAKLDHRAMPLPSGWVSGKINAYERQQLIGQDFANCVIAADPATVDAMLRTEVRSKDEAVQFRKLVPVLGPCLPKGVKLEMDVAWMRSVGAEALLRSIALWQPKAVAGTA